MPINQEIQNNKLIILGKLAASLAHEIRNPLSVLKLNLDYLDISKNELPDEIKESLDICMDSVERIHALVDNTLDISRKPTQDLDICDINIVCENAIKIITHTASIKGIKIIPDYKNNLPNIYLNNNKIMQVILNLVTNAIEASSFKDNIFIRTLKEEDKVIVVVEDEGTGITEENKLNIFNEFYTNKKTGTGLGLHVCKTLMNEHNAEIDFESSIGKGTKFILRFPANPSNNSSHSTIESTRLSS